MRSYFLLTLSLARQMYLIEVATSLRTSVFCPAQLFMIRVLEYVRLRAHLKSKSHKRTNGNISRCEIHVTELTPFVLWLVRQNLRRTNAEASPMPSLDSIRPYCSARLRVHSNRHRQVSTRVGEQCHYCNRSSISTNSLRTLAVQSNNSPYFQSASQDNVSLLLPEVCFGTNSD